MNLLFRILDHQTPIQVAGFMVRDIAGVGFIRWKTMEGGSLR